MKIELQSFPLVGRKPTGQSLPVAIYAESVEDAERQYEFRYRGLGYLLPKDFTPTPEGDTMPIVKVRSRRKSNELHQSHQEANTAEATAGMGTFEGALDHLSGESGEDHQNVVYVGQ